VCRAAFPAARCAGLDRRATDATAATEHAHRRRVYFMLGDEFQIEFVEYKTQDATLRNAYF
jgi:hypothetical protein